MTIRYFFLRGFFLSLSVFSALAEDDKAAAAVVHRPTLNILTTMDTLSPQVMGQFEQQENVNVRVEFVGNRTEFEPRLQAGLKNYDIIIADERILTRLSLAKLIRSFPDALVVPALPAQGTPLSLPSKLDPDGKSYGLLWAEPMGIAYNTKHAQIPPASSWEILISPQILPYWRGHIFVSNNVRTQFLLALLATNTDIRPQAWFLPVPAAQFLESLKEQSVVLNAPLEMGFLSGEIEAAVLFSSEYVRTAQIVPSLAFFIPPKATYYQRMGVGWSASTTQESLVKKCIQFLRTHQKELSPGAEGRVPLEATTYQGRSTSSWVLYEDDVPFPKKIESLLKGG